VNTEKVSWEYYLQLINKLKEILLVHAQEKIDLVVAISRGGLFPGLVISEAYNVPLDIIVASSYTKENKQSELKLGKPSYLCFPDITKESRILIIDDLCDTGKTMGVVVNLYKEKGFKNIRTAVLYYKRSSQFDPDYFAAGADEKTWIKFPYEEK
jgi:hypoxanthine phosphoribosyltransferase